MFDEAEDLYCELVEHFLKLAKGGGFELLRGSEKGDKELILIDVPQDGYTTEFLKAVVTSAKIKIRPLQNDLDMDQYTERVSTIQAPVITYKSLLSYHYKPLHVFY